MITARGITVRRGGRAILDDVTLETILRVLVYVIYKKA